MTLTVDILDQGLTACHVSVSLCWTTDDAFVRTKRLSGEVGSRDTLDDEELRKWLISSTRALNNSIR